MNKENKPDLLLGFSSVLESQNSSNCSNGSDDFKLSSSRDFFQSLNNLSRNQEIHLYEYSKEQARKKEEKLQKILLEEKRAREFKANPIPKWVGLMPCRGYNNLEEKKPSPFKARTIPQSHRVPFQPQHATKCTKPQSPKFATVERLGQREAFNQYKKQQEMLIEEAKKEAEEAQKKQEEKEVKKIRKNTEFHANPMPSYKEFQVKKSEKPLTLAKSPFSEF